jgi:diguanylate cyclase (GGDEF)-like protein/PAS domain S-box-containing protein
VASLFAPAQDPEAGWPESNDEIGALAAALRKASTEHLRLEQISQRNLQRLASVMEFAPVGLALTRGRLFEMVSPEMCRMFGRTEAELLGQPAQIIYASNEDYLAVGPAVQAAFEAGRPYLGQWQMLRANGTRLWVQLRGRPINPDDREVGTIWSLLDISDEVQSRHHLEWTAHHDALTGLANRKAFEQQATRVMNASPRSIPAALLVIDLDHFKPINDQFGHAAGDDMLRAVATAIGTCVRNNDLVVRYGGDEFVVLLERCSPKAAQRVAAAVEEAIQAVRQVRDGHVLSVGASVGMVVLAEHHADLATWMAAADAACYARKAARRAANAAKTADRGSLLRLVSNETQR